MRFDQLLTPEVRQRMTEIARGLRQKPTASEALLWNELRDRKLAGYKFRRQQPIGALVADFYCDRAGLVVELDGRFICSGERQIANEMLFSKTSVCEFCASRPPGLKLT